MQDLILNISVHQVTPHLDENLIVNVPEPVEQFYASKPQVCDLHPILQTHMWPPCEWLLPEHFPIQDDAQCNAQHTCYSVWLWCLPFHSIFYSLTFCPFQQAAGSSDSEDKANVPPLRSFGGAGLVCGINQDHFLLPMDTFNPNQLHRAFISWFLSKVWAPPKTRAIIWPSYGITQLSFQSLEEVFNPDAHQFLASFSPLRFLFWLDRCRLSWHLLWSLQITWQPK